MNNCFALRFNLQKSGYDFGENPNVFAGILGEDVKFIGETLEQYEQINSAAAQEIISKYDMSRLGYLQDKKVMLFGDSNTSDRLSYGKIIEKVLPCQVIDGAVSGWRSVQLLCEIDRMLYTNKPDIAVIQIGNNDSFFCDKEKRNLCVSPEEYRRNMEIIIDKAKSTASTVIVNSLTPSYCEKIEKNHAFWSATEENNALFNLIAKECAENEGVLFFDFRKIFEKERYEELFYPDGTHLTCTAHALIAEKLVEFLGDYNGNY